MTKTTKAHINNKSKFSRLYLLFFILALAPVGYFLFFSKAEPPPPTLYISPASQALAVNTNITFEVRENSGTTTVNAVQANLSYPTTLFDFVSIDSTTSAFGIEAQSTGASGQITIARGVSGGSPALTGDQLVAKVTLKAKTTGGVGTVAFTSGSVLLNSINNQNLITSLSMTGSGAFTVDNNAPTVSITAPASNAVISNGSNATISATASDNASGVASVTIFVDGVQKANLTTAPYNYTWNTGGVALGTHTIYARAVDGIGNAVNSTTISVTLADQTAPTVSITAPVNNSTVIGSAIAFNVTATDNSGGTGVSKVEFYVDNVLKANDTTAPYSFVWDSKTVTDGTHSLTAKAYDNATPVNVSTSSAINVNVDNADKIPPSIPTSFRSTSTTTSSISLAWNASTDNIGVTGYRLQRAGVTISSANITSFTDTALTANQSYTYTIVALDAAGNVSGSATLTVSTKAIKPGDVNGDDAVDIYDLSLMLSYWQTNNVACDVNKNGLVDIYDLSILLSNYGT